MEVAFQKLPWATSHLEGCNIWRHMSNIWFSIYFIQRHFCFVVGCQTISHHILLQYLYLYFLNIHIYLYILYMIIFIYILFFILCYSDEVSRWKEFTWYDVISKFDLQYWTIVNGIISVCILWCGIVFSVLLQYIMSVLWYYIFWFDIICFSLINHCLLILKHMMFFPWYDTMCFSCMCIFTYSRLY